jgi:pimeloyl-ACP methyl ester carboxylesterase
MAVLRRDINITDSVIFLDTKASSDTAEAKANRHRIAEQMRTSGKVELFAEQMMENLISEVTKSAKPQVASQVRNWIKTTKPETIAWLQEAMANRPDSFEILNEFEGHALLIKGADDAVTSRQDFVDLEKNLRQATYVEIPDTGHLPIVEDPAAVTYAICGWLAKTLAR